MASEIIITGVSGRFPESDSVAEFSKNLYSKVDLITEDKRRWEPGLHGLPRRMGHLKDISKFDNQFFGVHNKQAHQLDPQVRILLELTHESIVDAGYYPEELRGRNIGVYIGNSLSESNDFFNQDPKKINGYAMTGCIGSMFANRVSYAFDFKGPSFLMDTACSSGALALYEAVQAIKTGQCEAAIVGGANLCLRPGTALQFYKLNMLSDDGRCKSFDAAGLCSIVKVLISMENDLIPPNLHYYTPNPNIPALVEGKVQIVTEPTPWNGDYAAISCFGFGGVNVHTVLKANRGQSEPLEKSPIPQLALYGGRTEEGVNYLFDYLQENTPLRDFFALLHKSAYAPVSSKPFRGYKLMGQELSAVKKIDADKRPIWFIFSGMGSQWPCMGKDLMNVEVFADSIRRSSAILKPYGLDLVDLVTNEERDTSNARSIIPAFVSIAAVQTLREHVRSFRAVPASRHGTAPVFVSTDLFKTSHVFLRIDRVRKSLEPPYAGPYKVLKRTDKVFEVEINGKPVTVSIDRIKAAHLMSEDRELKIPSPVPQQNAAQPKPEPEVFTRSGRRSRPVVRFNISPSTL